MKTKTRVVFAMSIAAAAIAGIVPLASTFETSSRRDQATIEAGEIEALDAHPDAAFAEKRTPRSLAMQKANPQSPAAVPDTPYLARNVPALLRYADAHGASDPDVSSRLAMAAGLCQRSASTDEDKYVELRARGLLPDGDSARRSLKSFQDMQRSICQGIGAETIFPYLDSTSNSTTKTSESEAAELEKIALAGAETATRSADRIWAIIDSTASPTNFLIAADAAAISGTGRFAGSHELVSGSELTGQLVDLRRTAAQAAYCRMSDACTAGSIDVALQCRAHNVCRAGMNFDDIVVAAYSPAERQVIETLAAQLLSGRQP
jgi:hypothetical protein